MEFEWNHNKNESNRAKHGIGFDEAKEIFDGPVFTVVDDRFDYGERREISIGSLGVAIVVVVHTERRRKTRLISARKANRKERETYYAHLEKTRG